MSQDDASSWLGLSQYGWCILDASGGVYVQEDGEHLMCDSFLCGCEESPPALSGRVSQLESKLSQVEERLQDQAQQLKEIEEHLSKLPPT